VTEPRPSSPRRRRADPEQRRADILAAALEVFAERGYRAASLAAVAERVGLTQQGVLHYFPTKDALLIEVLRLRDQLDIPADGVSHRLADIEELVAYNATRPGLIQSFTVLSAESVTEDHPAKEYFTTRYAAVRAHLTEEIRAEVGDELAGGLTPAQVATLLVAVMDGLQLQWLLDPDEIDMPTLVTTFLGALRPQPKP
jgi:AcrR family transcriptional regulator